MFIEKIRPICADFYRNMALYYLYIIWLLTFSRSMIWTRVWTLDEKLSGLDCYPALHPTRIFMYIYLYIKNPISFFILIILFHFSLLYRYLIIIYYQCCSRYYSRQNRGRDNVAAPFKVTLNVVKFKTWLLPPGLVIFEKYVCK